MIKTVYPISTEQSNKLTITLPEKNSTNKKEKNGKEQNAETTHTATKETRGTAGCRSPALIHKWNNLTVRYAGLIPPVSPSS